MIQAKLQAIKGKAKFDELFKSGTKFRNKDCLSLITYESDPNEINPNINRVIFYAVAVSKKTAKKAVIRNRIKRLIRESFRQLLKEESTLFDNIKNIIIIWRWAPVYPGLISMNEVKESLKKILLNSQSYISSKKDNTN
ncbi:MAG: ribonuclease P protein component [bacterium]